MKKDMIKKPRNLYALRRNKPFPKKPVAPVMRNVLPLRNLIMPIPLPFGLKRRSLLLLSVLIVDVLSVTTAESLLAFTALFPLLLWQYITLLIFFNGHLPRLLDNFSMFFDTLEELRLHKASMVTKRSWK